MSTSTRAPNPWAKTRPVNRAYLVVTSPSCPGWEWRILKMYQSAPNARRNPYARAYTAVRSPMTYGEWEYGDTYLLDIPGWEQVLEAQEKAGA